jgi:predicted ABC-type ATPase
VVRGNSGAGKSTVAAALRDACGRGVAWVSQDLMAETLGRHATRPQAAEFGADQMREWYRPRDLLAVIAEQVIPAASTLPETVALILADTGLLEAPGRDTTAG